MNPWTGILKKEFRLSRMGVTIALLVMALYIGLSFYISWKADPLVLLPMAWVLVFGHIFYFPIYIAFSIHREKHTMHYWLHSPQSGNTLIAAKLINGFAALCVSLFIACSFFLFAWWINKEMIEGFLVNFQDVLHTGLFVLIHILLISFYFALWGTLLSFVEIISKQKLGKWRGVILIAIIFFGPWLWRTLEGTWLYHALTHWGAIPLSTSNLLHMFNVKFVYFGAYVFHAVIGVALFFLSSWILDRKVEV